MLEDVRFCVADGPLVRSAVRARAETFLRDFGQAGDDGKDEIGHHLVSLSREGEVVAGCRLLGPESRPFPFETVLDLSALVDRGSRPALLGRLFVRHDYRTADKSTYLLLGLLRLARQFASDNHITDFYIGAFGHLIRLYERAGFQLLNAAVDDEHWRTLHLMHMRVSPMACDPST